MSFELSGSRFRSVRTQSLVPAACAAVWFFGASLAATRGADATTVAPVLTVSADHPQGVYALGEPIRWRIDTGNAGGFTDTHYSLKQGGQTVIREGKLALSGSVEEIEATVTEPGTLLLEVKATDSQGKVRRELGGAIVAPGQIPVSMPRPGDFDAFWQAKIQELGKVPANPVLAPGESGREGVDYWQITMDNIRGTHIRGQLARPKGQDKRSAMLVVQWAGVYGLAKSWATDPAASGWLVLNINAHDLPIDKPEEFYKEQSQGPLKDYWVAGNDNRDQSYFLRMYLSAYRAAQYLAERPDWDGKTLLVTGVSQGGLQTLMLAGLHPKITAAIACVPAGCDLTGPKIGRSPGWPGWYWNVQGKDPAKVIEAGRYYDVVNFAEHVKCPVLVGVGLIDETCPAAGILAAVNQMKGPREVVFLPKGDHQGTGNTHAAFNDRAKVWKEALLKGGAAPAK
jgi:cephalosporin-C deacetylase-like acetyl esterase